MVHDAETIRVIPVLHREQPGEFGPQNASRHASSKPLAAAVVLQTFLQRHGNAANIEEALSFFFLARYKGVERLAAEFLAQYQIGEQHRHMTPLAYQRSRRQRPKVLP